MKSFLGKDHNPLVGCIRQGIWTQGIATTDFQVQRGAYLESIASHVSVRTPAGLFSCYLYSGAPIRLYGGTWRGWWLEDLRDEWCLIRAYTSVKLQPHGYLIQLDGSRLSVWCYRVEVEPEVAIERAEELVSVAIQQPPGRLAKNTQRAYVTCKYCSVKQRCDSVDALVQGGRDDWGRSYPFP